MPLPWLIGAAVAAAVVAVAKAVSDDDSPSSSSDSGDAERRRQQREASRQRERDGLTAKLNILKKDQLEDAHQLLACSAETLAQLARKTTGPSTAEFNSAFVAKKQATSAYAQDLNKILYVPHQRDLKELTQKERQEFLINLQILETLYGAVTVNNEMQQDIAELQRLGSRINRLHHLKNLLKK